MKKHLSLVLALVMILGSFTSVFAANTVDADAAKVASEFLNKKGVIVGDEKGNLNLDKNLLRQDTVVLVSKLMGEYDLAKSFPTAAGIPTYKDIRDNFYLPLLAWAQANETFVGHTNDKFGFGETLLAQEYVKVLLVALEYSVGPNGNTDVSWKDVLVKAEELGILKDVEVENDTQILRSQMAVMTFNALGVKVNNSTKTLAEKLGIVMPTPDKPTVLKATVKNTENLKEIVVELSNAELADEDKLQDVQNYKVEGFVVEDVRLDGDNVIVLLKTPLVKGRTYDLTIRNIDKAINAKYSFKAEDNTLPEVKDVKVLGEYGIKVTTSEPIKEAKERNFLVDGRNVSMKVEQYGNDIILTPYYNAAFSMNAEVLTIKELEDFAGYKSVAQDFDIKIVKDEVAPKVVDMISRGNVVEVTFDKDIYDDSVGAYNGRTDLGNISYQEGRQTIYATGAEKVATNKVKYTFEKELPRRSLLTLVDVSNHSKVKMDKITQEPRLVLDYSEPEITKKTVKVNNASSATITLKFDKDVEGNFISERDLTQGFKIENHFTLFERDVYRGQEAKGKIQSAKYDVKDGKIVKDTVIVEITGLTEYNKNTNDLNYVLEVENFTDATSLRNKMYRDYVDFKVVLSTGFFVEAVKVDKTYSNTTEIKIELSKAVDKTIAEEHTNYLFKDKDNKIKDVKDLEGKVYAERNGKTITIILPNDKFDVDKFDSLRILNTLKDINGNRLDEEVTYVFGLGGGLVESDARAAKRVSDQIAKLPAVADVKLEDKTAIEAANAAYTALSADRKALVSSDMKTKLNAVVAKLAELEANAGENATVKNVKDMVAALPSVANVKLENKAAVVAAIASYDALTANQKAELELEGLKLTALENKIAELEVEAVKAKIAALPASADVTLANEEAIVAARAAYTALNADQQGLVTLTKLTDAEAKIVELKDQAMVNAELNKVGNVILPAATDLGQNQEVLVQVAVETKVDTAKVTVTVTKGADDSTYNVKLDSIAGNGTANKNVVVTKAQ